MNSLAEPTAPPSGVSIRTLLMAIGVTALLTGVGAWIWLRPASDAPSETEAHADNLPAGVVELSPEAIKNAGLTAVDVASRQLPTTIDVTGSVTAEDARVAHIRPLARGLVERVWVSLGERVTRGQPLATYDNIQLGELVGEYLAARAVLQQAEAELNGKRRVVDR